MPPRKARGHAPHGATYDWDDVLRDEVLANMIARIDMLAAQITQNSRVVC